jgi:hypothetical protein
MRCTFNSEDADEASAWVQEFEVAPSSGQIVSHDGQHYVVTERPQLARWQVRGRPHSGDYWVLKVPSDAAPGRGL